MTDLHGIHLHGINLHKVVYMFFYGKQCYTMLIYNCHGTVTIYMDYHEVVYNVNIGENKGLL